jgi:methylase of polypeptide subunit release factors
MLNDKIYESDISKLIKDLGNPDYITHSFGDIGIDSLVVLRTVFRPDKSYLGAYLARVLKKQKKLFLKKNVLDMGCGCGILGIVCSLNGAKSVYFSDINPLAIKNSKINSLLLETKNSFFTLSNLFNKLSHNKFDVIIFNSPTISGKPLDNSERAFIREDPVMLQFFKSFPKYLTHDGLVIMPGSTRFDETFSPLILAKRFNFKAKIIEKQKEDDVSYKYIVTIKI